MIQYLNQIAIYLTLNKMIMWLGTLHSTKCRWNGI